MAPFPIGTAFCIASPLNLNNLEHSLSEKTSATVMAVYSPNECPHTKLAKSDNFFPVNLLKTLKEATPQAIKAGWALDVKDKSFSLSPHIILVRSKFRD